VSKKKKERGGRNMALQGGPNGQPLASLAGRNPELIDGSVGEQHERVEKNSGAVPASSVGTSVTPSTSKRIRFRKLLDLLRDALEKTRQITVDHQDDERLEWREDEGERERGHLGRTCAFEGGVLP